MPYKKYNSANNAFAQLAFNISDTDTTLILSGKFDRFPTSNFIIKITHVVSDVVTARENIYVTARSGNTCTGLVRAYEAVPSSDSANTNTQQALPFYANDVVEVVVSAEYLKDIQDGYRYIPDMRNSAIPQPQQYDSQKTNNLEFRPATGAEVGNLGITGSTSAWFALETINAWNANEWQYVTQIAWSVHSSTFEMYVRKAASATTWGPWTKMLPTDASSLNMSAVPEIANFTNVYDYLPLQRFGYTNLDRKITVESLLKEIARLYCSGSSSSQVSGGYSWTTSNVAVPKGGLVTAQIQGIYNSGGAHPNPVIQWSADGSTDWTTVMTLIPGNTSPVVGTCFVKPGYTRGVFADNGYTSSKSFVVQVF